MERVYKSVEDWLFTTGIVLFTYVGIHGVAYIILVLEYLGLIEEQAHRIERFDGNLETKPNKDLYP